MKKAREDWIGAQYEEIETCLNKTTARQHNQLVKDLTSEKRLDPQLSRTGLGNVLLKNKRFSADGQKKLRLQLASLKRGKSARVDNILAEFVQAGGEIMINVLMEIGSSK